MMFSPTLGRWIQNDPIQFEGGDPNLYGFVGNNPATRLDPFGLIDITIDLQSIKNTDEEERANMPRDTIWSGENASLDKVLKLVKEKAGDQKIKHLTLTAHCGNQGMVLLAPSDNLNAGDITKWKELAASGKMDTARFKMIDKQVTFLKELAAMADKGGMTIDFVQCSSGGGDKGKQLIAEVSEVCGGDVTIKMYDKNVIWVGRRPQVTNWLSELLGFDKPTEVKKKPK